MASTASTSLNLELQTQGENDGTWGDKQKTNMQIIDAAIAGRTTVSLNGADATLADVDYTLDAAKYGYLYTSDADQDDRAIIIPNAPRTYIVHNASGTYQIGVKTTSGSAITIPLSSICKVSCDGSNVCTFSTPITNATTGAPNTSSGAAASTISVSPSGDLTSTDVQAALSELQGDIDAIEANLLASYQPLDADLTQIAGLSRSKGALIAGTSSAWSAQSVGTNGYALIADSASSTGVKWSALIPATTGMLFYQASAPTGWTAVAQNDKALRVVSAAGTGGSADGTTAFSSIFTARTIAADEIPDLTMTVTDPGHTHSDSFATVGVQGSGGTSVLDNSAASGFNFTVNSNTTGISVAYDSTGRGSAQQTIDFAVQYCDVIIATKD